MPPARHLTPPRTRRLAVRVARLVNASHGGNVSAAARAIGVDYSALWRVVTGRTVRPSLHMTFALQDYYGGTVSRELLREVR